MTDISNLDDLLVDDNKTETAKIHFGDRGDYFEVRHISNKKYLNEVGRLSDKQLKLKKRGRKQGTQENQDDMAVSFCRHLLVDWQFTFTGKVFKKNFPDIETQVKKDNKTKGLVNIPFSFQTAYSILRNRKMFTLLNTMIEDSADDDNFKEKNFEDDLKN